LLILLYLKKILDFLNSDKIKDRPVVKVDFESDDNKTITVHQETQRGVKKSKQKILKLLKYLGADLSGVKQYEVEELIGYLKKGDISNMQKLDGEKIRWAYHCNNNDGNTGSCMAKSSAQKYLDIYILIILGKCLY